MVDVDGIDLRGKRGCKFYMRRNRAATAITGYIKQYGGLFLQKNTVIRRFDRTNQNTASFDEI